MYKKIVVPLDGSNLAEQALLYLDEVAADCPEVFLVSVTEKITVKIPNDEIDERFISEHNQEQIPSKPSYLIWQPGMVYSPGPTVPLVDTMTNKVTLGKMARSAVKYLEFIGKKLAEKGFEVTTKVLLGDPAKEIVHYAEEKGADLILMASKGDRPGLSHWNMERIVEKVVETTKIPVMVVKPAPDFIETKSKRKGVAA